VKNQLDKLKTIIAGLKKLTEIESAAIGKRAFDQIAALTSQKESLLAEFDETASALEASALSEQIIAELDGVRAKAEENAAILQATARGVREARARLKKIREADINTGAYARGGAALRQPDASTITAKA
jgi:flagellar biosynthesis/type III secretory pathway chaperone